jgi:hypothetical protein
MEWNHNTDDRITASYGGSVLEAKSDSSILSAPRMFLVLCRQLWKAPQTGYGSMLAVRAVGAPANIESAVRGDRIQKRMNRSWPPSGSGSARSRFVFTSVAV